MTSWWSSWTELWAREWGKMGGRVPHVQLLPSGQGGEERMQWNAMVVWPSVCHSSGRGSMSGGVARWARCFKSKYCGTAGGTWYCCPKAHRPDGTGKTTRAVGVMPAPCLVERGPSSFVNRTRVFMYGCMRLCSVDDEIDLHMGRWEGSGANLKQ